MPQTKYAQCGDLSLAYEVFGEGAIDLVIACADLLAQRAPTRNLARAQSPQHNQRTRRRSR